MCTGARSLHVFCLVGLLVLIAGTSLAVDKSDIVYDTSPERPTPVMEPPADRLDLVSESFEGPFLPPGWTIMTTGLASTWEQTSGQSHSGANSAAVFYGPIGAMQDEWLITPALNTMGLGALFLEWYEYEAYWADWGLVHYIMVSTTVPDDPAAFDAVLEMTPANHTITQWADPVSVNLNAYLDYETVYVAFRYTGDYADDWYVDDIWVYEPSEHDVKAVAALPDGEQFAGGDTFTPQAEVLNLGQNTETFPVQMQIFENEVEVYNESAMVTDLPSGESFIVDFSAFTVATGNLYHLVATTMLAGDEEPGNDTAESFNNSWSQQRVPLGLLVTNWDCGPCAPMNQVLDAYIPTQMNEVALMRVHGWWPGSDDPIYLANVEQSTALIEGTPTGSDYAPHLWLDGTFDAEHLSANAVGHFEDRKLIGAPLTVEINYDQENSMLWAQVSVLEYMNPNGDYRLRVAVTEDNIYAPGTNGESYHNQAFRYMYPGLDGLPVEPAIGSQEFWVELTLDPSWDYDLLRATVYVQEMLSKDVYNAGTMFLHEGVVAAFLQDFTAEPLAGSVELTFQFSESVAADQLELVASNGSSDWTVPVTVAGVGFEARDTSPNLSQGGTVTYSLFHNGTLIGTESVVLSETPTMTMLQGAYPNPFNPMTNIKFSVDRTQVVRIAMYDMSGRLVSVIADEVFTQGAHSVQWDGNDLSGRAVSSGSYFARMEAKGFFATEKLMLVR